MIAFFKNFSKVRLLIGEKNDNTHTSKINEHNLKDE